MKKKITVITGGSSGMGLATAHCLADKTALLLCARNEVGLAKAKRELEAYGAEVYTMSMDASNVEDARKCAEYAASLGEVVNVIHTAGVSPANTVAEDIIRINLLGPINVTQAFYPVLAESGVLICFGSTAGYALDTQMAHIVPEAEKIYARWQEPSFCNEMLQFVKDCIPFPTALGCYCLTKNFVKYFMRANVTRFAKKGCRIISISPGSYLTRMHQALIDNDPQQAASVMTTIPMERWGHAYEIGKLVEFLCSNGAGYITGVDILADGGCTYSGIVPQIN